MRYGFHGGTTPNGLGRSFMKGPRFFVKPSHQRCCEKCVYGTGSHSMTCVAVKAEKAHQGDKEPPK